MAGQAFRHLSLHHTLSSTPHPLPCSSPPLVAPPLPWWLLPSPGVPGATLNRGGPTGETVGTLVTAHTTRMTLSPTHSSLIQPALSASVWQTCST